TRTFKKDREQITHERFLAETAEHAINVLHDDGLYRHIRCQRPGTYIYGFDIVTWPGFLTICGDMGTYTFARDTDMFTFFGPLREDRGINPHYWSEKLQAPRGRGSVKKWNEDVFRANVAEWRDQNLEELTEE